MEKGGGEMMVTNMNGCKVNFGVALELMDDSIRESIAASGIESAQGFFTAYEIAYREKYGEEWELSKENPTY